MPSLAAGNPVVTNAYALMLLSDAAYALNGEFNSTGVDCVDMQDPMSTDSSLESGDIGTNEMEGITSPKFQQKWRF